MSKRKGLSKMVRFEVFKRDNFACQYCGAHPPAVLLHVDHIKAVAAGGDNDSDNLITSCQACNLGKGARDLKVVPQSMADKAKETQEREAQLAGYQEIFSAKRERLEREVWKVLEALAGCGVQTAPNSEFSSTKRFLEQLGFCAVLDAADIARAAPISDYKRFRYFCGVCWNMIRRNAEASS
jgi:hypothetical protein